MRVSRRKRWRVEYFNVVAPSIFDGKDVGVVIAKRPESLIGRTLEVPLNSLTNNPLHQFIKCKLKIVRVEDSQAFSIYYGHEYFREYVRSLFSRGSSYVEIVRDVKTSDNGVYRILAGVFTRGRTTTSRKKAIRRSVFEVIDGWGEKDDDDFIKDAVYGVIDSHIVNVSKKIYPVKWAGIIKVKVVQLPSKII